MSLLHLTSVQLRDAAALQSKIESLASELVRLQGNGAAAAQPARTRGGRRNISAAGRAKIRAAQKARWAKVRAALAGK